MRLAESCRVLIVEDNADALESLRLQMELWGNEVSTARTAEEALEKAAERPGRRSCCATSACRAWTATSWSPPLRKKLAGAPVVFAAVTGYASPEDQAPRAGRRLRLVPGQAARAADLAKLLRATVSRAA